ncbi:MAG: 3'-5' exonuclease [Candidatus Nanopelagicales bacterium]
MPTPEVYVSIDVETTGPTPHRHAMIALGACLVTRPDDGFYVELRPDRDDVDPDALAVSGLSLERLRDEGADPAAAMRAFVDWVGQVTPEGCRPVFTAFNAPFDWMFVHDYLLRYVGENPFGHSALDVKSYYMGLARVPFGATGFRHAAHAYGLPAGLSHNALQDARDQARLFRRMTGVPDEPSARLAPRS